MRAPRNFDDLKQQISRRFGELSGRLQQIAEFALRHPNELALGTVATVATNAGVQPSSIIIQHHPLREFLRL
jgi:DNA-binding MurR/RpiR family transcriptional regulator